MLKRFLLFFLISLCFNGIFSQSLTLNDLMFYLNPANFRSDSILIHKGFSSGKISILSKQQIMYVYNKSEASESLYFGGIDHDIDYRTFHISYYFNPAAYKDYAAALKSKYPSKGRQRNDAEKFESTNYIFYLYPKDLIKIFSKIKYKLADSCRLNGSFDSTNNVFVEKTNSFFFEPFDSAGIAVFKSKLTSLKGLINLRGEVILLPRWESIKRLPGSNYYLLGNYDSNSGTDPLTGKFYIKYELADSGGNELLPGVYQSIELISNNEFLVIKDGIRSNIKLAK